MNCRFPGCPNIPTKWSRHSYCGEHRGAAVSMSKTIPQRPAQGKKGAIFEQLKREVNAHFRAPQPIRSSYGYHVLVQAPNGLRA